MSDSNLPDSVVEAIARLHGALPHDVSHESDLYFVRSELVKAHVILRGQEKTIRRLEDAQLKQEEMIATQADRILLQHRAAIIRERALDDLRIEHARLLADHNQSTVRHVLARIMGKYRAKD